jgi:major type 1 subunit fimbrin (pilin)
MKKALTALAAVAAIYGTSAHAGLITFAGTLSSTTCSVTGAGGTGVTGTSGDFTVGLGSPAASSLGSTVGLAGPTYAFSINLTGCGNYPTATATPSPAARAFFSSNTNITSGGRLKNASTASTPATGVELALLEGSNVLNLAAGDGAQGTQWVNINTSTNSASLQYAAQYYVTSAAVPSAGDVNTTVTYSIDYQ